MDENGVPTAAASTGGAALGGPTLAASSEVGAPAPTQVEEVNYAALPPGFEETAAASIGGAALGGPTLAASSEVGAPAPTQVEEVHYAALPPGLEDQIPPQGPTVSLEALLPLPNLWDAFPPPVHASEWL